MFGRCPAAARRCARGAPVGRRAAARGGVGAPVVPSAQPRDRRARRPRAAPPAISAALQERAPVDSPMLSVSCLSMRALILGPAAVAGAGARARACGRVAAARAAGAAPACEPATLNNSALLAGSVTVSPLPGSRDASPQTQISFLGVPTGELSRDQRRRLAHRRARGPAARLLAGRRRQLRAGAGRSREGETVTVTRAAADGRRRAAAARQLRDRLPGHAQHHARDDPPRQPAAKSRASARARTCTRRRSP